MTSPDGAKHSARRYAGVEALQIDGPTSLLRARDERSGTPVLLRVVDPRRSSAADLERLTREHEMAASLHLTTVARPLGIETHDGAPALVLEDWGGEPLDRAFALPLPLNPFLEVAVRLAGAVADLHQQGVVHKDIKPQNVLVHPTSLELKLVGLGLATRLPHQVEPALPLHLIAGSLPYMSPEQTGRTNSTLDSRSDLYSLGATLHQLLTGRLLCDAHDPLAWLHFHVARMPVPPSELVPGLPQVISQIVMRLLAKAPEDRYQTARGLERDLTRCRAAWHDGGRIDPFPLGEHDLPDRLQFPQKLYAREAESAELLEAFKRVVETGDPELVLVSGYSGIGKSSLVGQLESHACLRGGNFITSKAEPHQRDIPYSTLAQAFGHLVLRIIAAEGDQSASWKQRLQEALGAQGQLIAAVVPQVELLLGKQGPVTELAPAEARTRFRTVFRRFAAALADQEHPLVLVLDDLQWADADSFPIVQDLVTDSQLRFLLVVGVYRDNEVTADHPLALVLKSVNETGARVTRITLGPLPEQAVASFVDDTLHCGPDDAARLARAICEKTAGNPFFFIRLLTELHNDRLLHLDERTETWSWDAEGLRRRAFADNVTELMVTQLKRLPEPTQEAAKQLACLGGAADTETLAVVLGVSKQEVRGELWNALAGGFVVVRDDTYHFAHDAFREAAYSLVSEQGRPAAHLRIARLLLAHLPDAAIAERVFEVVGHLDRGLALIDQPSEREVASRWNALAGRRAKRAVAYTTAAAYLKQATQLLPPSAWIDEYGPTLELQLDYCECEYLGGDFAAAETLAGAILEQAHTDVTRARVHRLRIRMYELAGRNEEAMSICAQALGAFGLIVPSSPEEVRAATEREEHLVTEFTRGRRVAELIVAPPVEDPNIQAALSVIADSLSPAYMAQQAHFPLLCAMGVNVCLRNGHTAESSSIYNSYALGRAGVGDFQIAFEFSDLALNLLSRVESLSTRGIVLFRHAFFILPWRQHLLTSLPHLRASESACGEGGNLLYAGYARFAAIETAIEMGRALDDVQQAIQDAADLARSSNSDAVRDTLLVQKRFAACLQGTLGQSGRHGETCFRELGSVAGFATWRLLVLGQMLSYTFGDYEQALDTSERAAEALRGVVALMLVATHHFYRALTLAALCPVSGDARRARLRLELDEELRLHARWAEHCPANFANRHALLAAEIARIEGRDRDAALHYQQAIRSAREHGFVNNEALAYELAARFQRARGLDLFADSLLREARGCYLRWGADGKVRQLEEHYPQLVGAQSAMPAAIESTFETAADQLDLLSVIKASQTISREIEIDKLVGSLLEIVLQHSGARRGCLLLAREGSLAPVAEATLDEAGVATRVLLPGVFELPSLLPNSVLRRAQSAREPMLIDEASLRPAGSDDDPYFALHQPRSVLALPILRGDDHLALLYLENDMVAGAFRSDTLLTTLSLIAAQAAISLENALQLTQIRKLNRELEQRVAERTADLAEANRELDAFAHTVSHDLRAPLRAIDHYRELLERHLGGALDDQARRYLSNIAEDATRMRRLIDDLLSFARLAQTGISRRAVELGALTRDVIRELLRRPARSHVEWVIPELPVVMGDPAMLRVVLMNLLSNALKFTAHRAHAKIEVGTRRDADGSIVVFVRDNGAGFDMAYADRLFGVFQRLHNQREFPGTGIGLASVRRIIARLGGRTWAEGVPDGGATFYFTLPKPEEDS